MNSQKVSEYNEDKDDLGNIPESCISLSHNVETELLPLILPDLILLSESLKEMLDTTRAKIDEPVLEGQMTR